MAFIEFQGITKRFGGVHALEDVGFSIERGSCHALMGENGAGKSTLGKVLAGLHQSDAGHVLINGQVLRVTSPLDARRQRIAMVHQELAFCPNLSIGENLCLGDLPTSRFGLLDRAEVRRRARLLLDELGVDLDADQPMSGLTTGQEQVVQIAAAMAVDAEVVVMDEPTSSLSVAESERLFVLLGKLKAKGVTVIYVSHRMDEIFRLCDAITILRDGRHVLTRPITGFDRDAVIRAMIGRDLLTWTPDHRRRPPGAVRLSVNGLSAAGFVHDVTFQVRAGEVVGFAGMVGAGRSEIAVALFGLDPLARGTVLVDGQPLRLGSITASLEAGIGLVPEDRKRQGLVLGLGSRENISLSLLDSGRISTLGVMRRSAETAIATEFTQRMRLKAASLDAPVSSLSGGNQQKVALAKWIAGQCKILIVDEPTRGVDVGAKSEIHGLIDELASQGVAVLVISSDLPEVMALSSRILVLRDGRIVGEITHTDFNQDRLIRAMAGYQEQPAA